MCVCYVMLHCVRRGWGRRGGVREESWRGRKRERDCEAWKNRKIEKKGMKIEGAE